MIRNILTIFDRLTIKYMKQRKLIVYLAIQNILLAVIALIFTNVILSSAIAFGQLNFNNIKLFYTFCILVLFVISYIMSPIFMSRTVNSMYKNSIIDNLMASRVTAQDIVYASFLRGFTFVVIMVVSAIPITSISFYFGGISFSTILKIFFSVLLHTVLLSAICIYISSYILDENLATVIAYVVGLIVTIITIVALNVTLWNNIYLIMYSIFVLSISIAMLTLAKNAEIFTI